MSSIVILKAGFSLPQVVSRFGDFEDWIIKGMNTSRSAVTIRSAITGDVPTDYTDISGIIITGSHEPITDEMPWMLASAGWLRGAIERNIPTLGICFGHQLLAYALGGQVGNNPRGAEICTTTVQLTDAAYGDPLFRGLTSELIVHTAHYHTVLQPPPGIRVLANNAMDDFHAVRFANSAWGMQFHPEMTPDIVRGYQDAFHYMLPDLPADRVFAETGSTLDYGIEVLRRFVKLTQ